MKKKSFLLVLLLSAVLCLPAGAAEEMQYKRFRFDDASCDVGLMYKHVPDGLKLYVSAIAYGKGAEFRKWKITDIKLRIGESRIKPKDTFKFYVREESLWKYPSAVLFAVIGAQIPAGGSVLQKGITRTGAAIGLGILTLAAEGDIAGERCIFTIDSPLADRIVEGVDYLEIDLEHPDLHLTETVKIGIAKSPKKTATCEECAKMSKDELAGLVDSLEGQVKELERQQAGLVSGQDPRYDTLERDIEFLETRRGVIYNALLEKKGPGN